MDSRLAALLVVGCLAVLPHRAAAQADFATEAAREIDKVREVRRVRTLAAYAQPALAGVLALLSEGGVRMDPKMLDKFGWRYLKTTGADGAEEHYFPLVAVGHGIAHLPTLVRFPRGARRAILVQADTMKLCENYGLQDKTPLCRNTRQSLAEIARRLDARFGD